jgi:hypothetical protein
VKHPTYKQAIEGLESKDPKERIIGLKAMSKGLKWRSKAKTLGLKWKGNAVKHHNIEKLIVEFKKQPPGALLDYRKDGAGLIMECDYKKYYQRFKEWEQHQKANKKRLNDQQKDEKKQGKEKVRKGFKAIRNILKEKGMVPMNLKEDLEGNDSGVLEFELSPNDLGKASRIKPASRRGKRISKLKQRLKKYTPKGIEAKDPVASKIAMEFE